MSALGRCPKVALRRERFTLADGDFVDLDWLSDTSESGPILLILHGLEGSSKSAYVNRLLRTCQESQWRAVVMHFRGCSGEPNRLARGYHCGETGDLDAIIHHLTDHSDTNLCAVAYSLGGSVLLRWLSAHPDNTRLKVAAAVSVPFQLQAAAERLDQGFSRLYQWVLLRSLKESLKRKAQARGVAAPNFGSLKTFRAFDGAITAPLHGFTSADDYYSKASCRPHLQHIRVPTLLIQALDDPFMTATGLPKPDELSPQVQLELSKHGGHVGFVGGTPWAPHFWLNDRLKCLLEPYMSPKR